MNPAELSLTISPTLTKATPSSKHGLVNGTAGSSAAMLLGGKTVVQRVELESLYTQLKAALGDAWADYKTALSQFALGTINQSELSWVLQPLLVPTPLATGPASSAGDRPLTSTLHLHNSLLAALYANSMRDPPPSEVAPWVVATDKPSSGAKGAGAASGVNDQMEERLKREVMALQARDRKRIKSLKEQSKPGDSALQEILEYSQVLAAKAPTSTQDKSDGVADKSSGLGKTNFDIEIRRRFAQPLACETLEFPSLTEMQNRIEPICYEEGLTGGVQQGSLQSVAELVEQSAEVFVKEMLASLLGHAHANAAHGDGVQTYRYRRQLRKEEMDAERGVLQRNPAGFLPVQLYSHGKRDPLTSQDVRLAMGLNDTYLASDRFLEETVWLSDYTPASYTDADTKMLDINGHLSSSAHHDGKSHLLNGIGHTSGATAIKNDVVGGNADADADADADAEIDPDAMLLDALDAAADPTLNGDLHNFGFFRGVAGADHDVVMAALDDCFNGVG